MIVRRRASGRTMSGTLPGPRRSPRRTATVCVAALTMTGMLAACSSSSKSAAGSAQSATTAPAATSGASPTTAGSSALSADQSILTAAEAFPTHIPQTTPLTSAPPKGKTLVFLQCEISQCTDIGSGIKAAAAAAGWNEKILNFQSANPATLITALKEALQYKPTAVVFSGLPEVLWQSEIPAYQAAGAVMIPMFAGPLTTPSPNVIPYNIGATEGTKLSAKQLAAWIAVDSGGKGHILLLGVPSFPLLAVYTDAFKQYLPTECPGCTVTEVDATIPQVDSGQVDSVITSALTKDPSLNYLSVVDGAFVDGLPSAMAAAGLSGKVKVTGIGADVANETDILAGKDMYAFTALATVDSGWVAVDAALRHAEGMPVTDIEDGGLPGMLLTKQTMTANHIQPANSFNFPSNYGQQFQALWSH